MTNPMTSAREEAGEALAGIGVPVFLIPPGAASGPYIHLVAGAVDQRGHVEVEVTVSAPLASPMCVDLVEQMAWDVREHVAATKGMGWQGISAPLVDTESQRLIRTIIVTTRP